MHRVCVQCFTLLCFAGCASSNEGARDRASLARIKVGDSKEQVFTTFDAQFTGAPTSEGGSTWTYVATRHALGAEYDRHVVTITFDAQDRVVAVKESDED